MKIGVLSDTHIPRKAASLPMQVLKGLAGVDFILHAGDLLQEEVIWLLQDIAPVEAVAGNVDSWELAEKLGYQKILNYDGVTIGLTHGHIGKSHTTVERVLNMFSDVDCIVFGHSHQAYNEKHGEILLFNPGSSTDKRFSPQYSYGILSIEKGKISGELFYF